MGIEDFTVLQTFLRLRPLLQGKVVGDEAGLLRSGVDLLFMFVGQKFLENTDITAHKFPSS